MDTEPSPRAPSDEVTLGVRPPGRPLRLVDSRVLHVLGAPAEEDGGPEPWLLALVGAERAHGLEPQVVTQMGFRSGGSYAVEVLGGVPHHRVPGAARPATGAAPAEQRWLAAHATKLAAVVRKVRPAVLVPAGDQAVRRAAVAVGGAYGIPVVEDPPGRPADHLDAYESLGVLATGARAIAALAAHPEELSRLREHVTAARVLRPLEADMRGRSSLADDLVERDTWQLEGMPAVSLTHPVAWTSVSARDRTHAYHLHAWRFMGPPLARYDRDRQDRDLRWCVALAASWCRAFSAGEAAGTMAWYDMALAQRAPRLGYLLQETLRQGYDDEVTSLLHAAVVRHQRELHRSTAFAAHSNHGFYTAVGQLALARRLSVLPGMHELEEQGTARLRTVVRTQFAEDGGHLEHSPDYHRMLVDSFVAAMAEGLVDDPEVARRVQAAQEVMGWFVRPDGTLLQVGDTPERRLSRSAPATAEASTRFLVTGGRAGSPSAQTLRVLPRSGYAFVRSPQPTGRADHLTACYLSLMAGFHSRTHKHADDLSLTWFDRAQELLVDAGRFGYLDVLPADSPDRLAGFFYSRPERQYVESTRAHNTVEADGRDHERRDRAPYGSAILGAAQRDGGYHLEAEVDHGWWRHRRSVELSPGSRLRVRDEVTATDGRPHDFRVWWNLAHALAHHQDGPSSAAFVAPDGTALRIVSLDGADLLEPVAGQLHPLRGWRSRQDRELTPAWSLGFAALGRRHHVFDTLLTLGDEASAHRTGTDTPSRS